MSEEKFITLYPSNWLYNAGVVGFLSCLDRTDYLDNNANGKYEIKNDGSVLINKEVFSKIKVDDNYFENGKVINLKGKNQYYPNFIDRDGNQKEVFKNFVSAFSDNDKIEKINCDLCKEGILVKKDSLDNNLNRDQKDKFFSKISKLNMVHNKLLGPSEKFPNSYWNLEAGFKICHLCTFILLHHHLALTKLSDGSEIFINAPSFKLMYELNKLVREVFGKEEVNATHKRE
ncbi:MAG: type I-B CRISPR-associated protein Cas8b1/Cst1, partial [Patescibacteria group bacterium]|nr:type I-B CRISPR-associated protein Cas8b1/Cst1 [Patescibacteria group bacterium]